MRTPLSPAALFTIARTWKPKRPYINGWRRQHATCIQWDIFSARRKRELLPFATIWVDLEGIMLNEIRQRKKNNV